MREVSFEMINVDGVILRHTFYSVEEFVREILQNDDMQTAISLDNEIRSCSVETAILDKSYFHTVNDLFMFCKGIVYARSI